MAATTAPIAPNVTETLARFAPEVREAIAGFHGKVWATVDPVLLELARLRIAMLLDDRDALARRTPAAVEAGLNEAKVAAIASWPDSPLFSERERAAVAFTEQFVGDVSGVTQGDVDALLEHMDASQTYAFVTGLLALDEHQRLSLAIRRLFTTEDQA